MTRRAVYYAKAGGAEVPDLRLVARTVLTDGEQLLAARAPSDLPPGICARLYDAWSPALRAEAERVEALCIPVRVVAEAGGGTGRLRGMRVLVTRAQEQSEATQALLRLEGAEPVPLPAIRFEAPCDGAPLAAAAAKVSRYDYVAFTSPRGVERFIDALALAGQGTFALKSARIFAVGDATARSLSRLGLEAQGVAARQGAAGLSRLLKERAATQETGLLVGPEPPDGDLRRALHGAGLTVDSVAAYRTVPGVDPKAAVALRQGPWPQAALFYSPSAVRGTLATLPPALWRGSRIVAVGPTTAEALRVAGLAPDAVAEEPSDAAVVDTLVDLWQKHSLKEEG